MSEFVKYYDSTTALHLRALCQGNPDQPDRHPLWTAFLAPKGLFDKVVRSTGRLCAYMFLEMPESPDPYTQIQLVLGKYAYGKPKQPSIHRQYTRGQLFLPVWSLAGVAVRSYRQFIYPPIDGGTNWAGDGLSDFRLKVRNHMSDMLERQIMLCGYKKGFEAYADRLAFDRGSSASLDAFPDGGLGPFKPGQLTKHNFTYLRQLLMALDLQAKKREIRKAAAVDLTREPRRSRSRSPGPPPLPRRVDPSERELPGERDRVNERQVPDKITKGKEGSNAAVWLLGGAALLALVLMN